MLLLTKEAKDLVNQLLTADKTNLKDPLFLKLKKTLSDSKNR
jgi:hypothetical protein